MARPTWKGLISFGLVNIPIVLYNSEDNSEKVSFHQIDKSNNARIRYARVNAITGKEVPWENIIKGYEYDKETILPLEEDELHYEAGEDAKTIEIKQFVEKSNINFIDIDKTYYLVPDKKGEKGYVILREALKDSKKIGIAKVIISTKEYMAAIACYENALVLYLLRYQSEIKPLDDFDIPAENLKTYKVSNKEIDIAKQLIKSMSGKWQPEKHKDRFADIVHKWAEKKIKKIAIPKHKKNKMGKTSNVVNFVDLLKQSLAGKKVISKKASASKKVKKVNK